MSILKKLTNKEIRNELSLKVHGRCSLILVSNKNLEVVEMVSLQF